MSFGTWLYTKLKGEQVGTDAFGNCYYRERGVAGKGARRWVVFAGETEASKVPPAWHAWLHRTSDAPPSAKPPLTRSWQKPHQPNPTGTAAAYRPAGAVLKGSHRRKATGDYEPWQPS